MIRVPIRLLKQLSGNGRLQYNPFIERFAGALLESIYELAAKEVDRE